MQKACTQMCELLIRELANARTLFHQCIILHTIDSPLQGVRVQLGQLISNPETGKEEFTALTLLDITKSVQVGL